MTASAPWAVSAAAATAPDDAVAAQAFLEAVEQLCRLCRIPTLAEYGVSRAAFHAAAEKMAADAMASGSPGNTVKPVTLEDCLEIYQRLWT